MSGWRRHPGVRSGEQLTLGERAADRMRNGMGSWAFVFCACLFLAAWMLFNRGSGFDPYPFILLNLVLSCLAAMQGAILLIAAKRSDQISSELAHHDYEADLASRRILETMQADFAEMRTQHAAQGRQLTALLEHLGVPRTSGAPVDPALPHRVGDGPAQPSIPAHPDAESSGER